MTSLRPEYRRRRTKLGPNLFYAMVECKTLADAVLRGEVFSLSRFGDGEFHWLTNKPGFVSRSGHQTFTEASERLRRTLLCYGKDDDQHGEQPPYLLAGPTFFAGYGSGERKARFGWYEEWIRAHGLGHLRWMSNLVFTGEIARAAAARKPFCLFAALKQTHTVVVGPPWLEAMRPMLGNRHYIRVAPRNCWLVYDRMKRDIVRYWEQTTERPIFFSLSCSFSANLLVHELADTVGQDCWLVDVGSIWDVYVGKYQRGYHGEVRNSGGVVL